MLRKFLFTHITISFIAIVGFAQNVTKKTLEHSDYDIWNTIDNPMISVDGRWVVYELNPGKGDGRLLVHDANTGKDGSFERGKNARISSDSRFVVFSIKPPEDTIRALRLRKVKREDLPKDTLAILDLNAGNLTKIPDVQSFRLPEKWSGWLAYLKEPAPADTTAQNGKKVKKESKDNGSTLRIRNLTTGQETAIAFVKSYMHAEEGARFAIFSTGDDADMLPGVYVFDATKDGNLQSVWTQKGDYQQLTFDKKGEQLAFVADLDTTKVRVRPFGIYLWKSGQETAHMAIPTSTNWMPKDWRVSEHATLRFSADGGKLFFGIAPMPILQDTSVLDDEVAKVEVWAYDEPVLHTIQNVRLERERKRTYDCVLHLAQGGRAVQLATTDIPETQWGDEGNAPVMLGYNQLPYSLESTWEWWNKRDLYLIDVQTGNAQLIGKGIDGAASLSPSAKFAYWYSAPDSAWFAYSIEKGSTNRLTDNRMVHFYNEYHDSPSHPNAYGLAGWLAEDAAVVLYDRYDLWRMDPTGASALVRLTNGRKDRHVLRYIRTDDTQRSLDPKGSILLSIFEESTKKGGYAWLNLSNNALTQLQLGAYSFANRPLKAKSAERWVFTRENFQVFPDLLYSPDLKTFKQISRANPQQQQYAWGSIELVEWTSLDGQLLQGLLVKPAGFDPQKQYPMIVNFYERSSDGLYSHRAPFPHRSQINYAYYASRGYVIFNPDIPYRIGYPGESAFNAVMSGTTAILDKGFVDRERVALQGHSWGGYQIAYILTRTNLFRCAESGAPVVNMLSAYGGIRWESGLSRAAQYERTQSRIGGSIWDYPLRYLENSPIFTADKIHTPVLILHNDKDGAVPWYQGIEFFIAMRRLGRPAWLLNYNDEPHWPVKRPNRMDFQLRMQQFFDYYLKDAPKPLWMEQGVPAIEKGIRQGYELLMQDDH